MISLKDKLRKREHITGCIIQGPFPPIVEIIGLTGFDFVFIDTEHNPMSARECEEMIRAAEMRSIPPLVRISNRLPHEITHYMDIGAKGILIPRVTNAEDIYNVVNAVKYQPIGSRGVCPAIRSVDFGLSQPIEKFIEQSNNQTVILPLVEDLEGIDKIEQILSITEVDGVIVGTSDLAQSLGVPGQYNHPKVKECVEKVGAYSKKAGKSVGTVVRKGEKPEDYFQNGFNIVLVNFYSLITSELKNFIKSTKV